MIANHFVPEGDPPRERAERLYYVRRWTPMPSGATSGPRLPPPLCRAAGPRGRPHPVAALGDTMDAYGRAWHTSPDQVREDLERERELRRLGWKFWRIRESEFCFDPERALQPLWQELDRRGIKPGIVPNNTGQASASNWSPIVLPDDEDELQPGTSLE